jgi:YesN/AraC family two-component response regulator
MDIKLDGSMSGIETAHLIRLMYDVPIIFITGYSDISILRSAMLTEPYGYILKPYDSLALQISIELAIKKHEKEKKVIESEAQYRSIAESFDSYIYINDNQYNIRFLNKKLRNKIGRNAESKKCYKAIYNLEEKCSWCPMKQILKGKVVRKIRYDEKEKNTFKEIHTPFNFKNSQVLKQSILQNIKVHKSEPSIYTSYNNKEEMYGEIHNRVKNNLKLISGFLNIKSSNLTD